MSYAQMFAEIDAKEGNTLIVFGDEATADAYTQHYAERMTKFGGIVARREDTRERTGLIVQWRDPVPAAELPRRMAEALWLLEEVIAGRLPRPSQGVVTDFTNQMKARIAEERDGA